MQQANYFLRDTQTDTQDLIKFNAWLQVDLFSAGRIADSCSRPQTRVIFHNSPRQAPTAAFWAGSLLQFEHNVAGRRCKVDADLHKSPR